MPQHFVSGKQFPLHLSCVSIENGCVLGQSLSV